MARQPYTPEDLEKLADNIEAEALMLRGVAQAMRDRGVSEAWIHADSLKKTYLRQIQQAVIRITSDVKTEVETSDRGLPSPFAASAAKAKRQSKKRKG